MRGQVCSSGSLVFEALDCSSRLSPSASVFAGCFRIRKSDGLRVKLNYTTRSTYTDRLNRGECRANSLYVDADTLGTRYELRGAMDGCGRRGDQDPHRI